MPSTVSLLTGRSRTRILRPGLLVVLLAAVTAVVGGAQSAQAFDCSGGDPQPVSCPFLKIDQDGTQYIAQADLLDPSGNVLHSWSEKEEKFTLWHWRWQGGPDSVHLTITPTDSNLVPKTFDFPASQSHCYLVTGAGVFPITGCDDSADPPN